MLVGVTHRQKKGWSECAHISEPLIFFHPNAQGELKDTSFGRKLERGIYTSSYRGLNRVCSYMRVCLCVKARRSVELAVNQKFFLHSFYLNCLYLCEIKLKQSK